MKRLIYLKNGQSLDLLVSPLKKSRPRYISAQKISLAIESTGQVELKNRKIIKNTEEKNPKLLFVYVHVYA